MNGLYRRKREVGRHARRGTGRVGAAEKPPRRRVCPSNRIFDSPDFRESREELLAKYRGLRG